MPRSISAVAKERFSAQQCELQLGFDFEPASTIVELRSPWARLREYRELNAAERLDANESAIALLTELASRSNQALNEDEKVILEGYSGFVPQSGHSWRHDQINRKVRNLLGSNANNRNEALLSAYYTPPVIATAMWDAVVQLGFSGGRVLEPCVGNGVFLATMPQRLQAASQVHAGDADEVAARVVKARFEGLTFHDGLFEQVRLPDGYFDLVITNVPFGSVRVASKEVAAQRFCLHDFFIAKALKKTRPGGLVAVITSHGTMDKVGQSARKFFDTYGKLIDGWRLPASTFESVDASVVTDVLFFQRKSELRALQSPWVETVEQHLVNTANGKLEPITLSQFFAQRADRVLGQACITKGRFGDELCVDGDLPTLPQLNALVQSLPRQVPTFSTESVVSTVPDTLASTANSEGEVILKNDDLFVVENGILVKLECPTRRARERVMGMVILKCAVRSLLDLQVSERATEDEIAGARAQLNQAYDQFVIQQGNVSQRANQLVFGDDPSYPLLLALEVYDEENETFEKAPIFFERTTWPRATIKTAANLAEAIRLATTPSQVVDLDEAARLLEKTREELAKALGETDEAFLDPTSRRYVARDAYLSGDVITKLETAESAAAYEPAFARNVSALRKVLPARIEASDIHVRLGSPWLKPQWVSEFAQMITGSLVSVSYEETVSTWSVGYNRNTTFPAIDPSLNAPRKVFSQILEHALNQSVPKVYDTFDGNPVLNREQTMNAQSVLQEIQKRFREWLFAEPERSLAAVNAYNATFNRYVRRNYGALDIPIMGLSSARVPRPHQMRAIARGLSGGNMLLAHKVGFGKTLILCALAMLYRQLGYAKKPMLVVKNSTLIQFTAEFVRLFPGARILMMCKEDLTRQRRKLWTARVAMGDWDAVIVPQSVFDRMRVSNDTVRDYLETECEPLDAAIRDTQGQAPRRLVQQRQSLRASIAALTEMGSCDDHISFEELGVDALLVDEADAYKNLGVRTKMEVKGIDTTQSIRALQMLLKVQRVYKVQGAERGVVFSTATPISNSVVEAFTMMRYLQPGLLAQVGLKEFDAWAATFGEVVLAGEVAPDGGSYRVCERFAKFHNLPELLAMTEQVWDLADPSQVDIKRPTERHHKVSIAPSARLKAYVKSCVNRAAQLQSTKVDPKKDNMLKVVGDGRKAALDIRLVTAGPGDADNKVARAAEEIHKRWVNPPLERATQLVFCDLSTPSTEWNVYAALKAALTDKGVPDAEIAFVQNYTTDSAKADLFRRLNAGSIRVLIGSTETLGVGVNVQRRLCAIHELDAPWRPRDVEQRLGRGVRQGNLNESVDIVRYVTEGSFDAYIWQALERKSAYIEAFMRGQLSVRTIEDISEVTLSFGELKAIACGNPLVKEKAMADFELARVESLHREFERKKVYAKSNVHSLEQQIATHERTAKALLEDLDQWRIDSEHCWKFTPVNEKTENALARAILQTLVFVGASAHGGHKVNPQLIAAKGDFVLRASMGWDRPALQLCRMATLEGVVDLNSSHASIEQRVSNDGVSRWYELEIAKHRDSSVSKQESLLELQQTCEALNPYDERLAKAAVRSDELRAQLENSNSGDSRMSASNDDEPVLKLAA